MRLILRENVSNFLVLKTQLNCTTLVRTLVPNEKMEKRLIEITKVGNLPLVFPNVIMEFHGFFWCFFPLKFLSKKSFMLSYIKNHGSPWIFPTRFSSKKSEINN